MFANEQNAYNTIDKALLNPAFVRGWDSIRRGAPFDYDEPGYNYERGRQAAILTRQVLGYVPPIRQSLELVRPIYLNARIEQWISGDTRGFSSLKDSRGKFSVDLYAKQYISHTAPTAAPKLDGLLGL